MKKVLLGLPILMALSCCIGFSASPKVSNLMAEDTLAHEEIFGEVQEAGGLGVRAPRKRASFESDFIKMGYQINFNAGGEGTADDTISIRFIAAIKDASVKAFWHRGFAQSNGYEGVEKVEDSDNWEYKLADNVYETGEGHLNVQSTKMFATLTDGSNTIEAKKGEYSEYEGFVIYTLRGIPYEKYKDAYLGAYLEVIDADNAEIKKNSNFAVVKVEKDTAYTSKNYFSIDYATYDGKYFLKGVIKGEDDIVVLDETPTDGNVAQKENDLTFSANDNFGVFRFAHDHFQAYGCEKFRGCSLYTNRVPGKNYCKIRTAGNYKIYVNAYGTDEVHMVVPEAIKSNAKVYLKPNSNWLEASARFSAYVFKGGTTKWYDMSDEGDNVYSVTFDPSTYNTIIFARMNPATSVNSFDDGVKWNQTSDIIVDVNKNLYEITGWDYSGNWSSINY